MSREKPCHWCGHYDIEADDCELSIKMKQPGETCFMQDRVSDSEYYRRARLKGWIAQERLF